MKRKVFVVFMIIFTIYIAITLLISLICGAPMGSRSELNRYLFGAVGMSVLLPVGFTFFFMSTLDLSKKVEEMEAAELEKDKMLFENMDIHILIRDFVYALSKKKNLSREKADELISYIEDL